MLKKVIIGFFAGLVSGLFATGGGLVLVPALVWASACLKLCLELCLYLSSVFLW